MNLVRSREGLAGIFNIDHENKEKDFQANFLCMIQS